MSAQYMPITLLIGKATNENHGTVITEDDARRIVACWNACAGIGTDALERGVVAEMLQALKDCEEAMDYMSEYEIPIALPGRVKAAIDKAEKEDE